MTNAVSLPDPRNIPDPLRDTFLRWQGERRSTHRRFGHVDGIKGVSAPAAAVKEYAGACVAGYLDGAAAYWRAQGDTTRPPDGRLVQGAKNLRAAIKRPRELLEAAHRQTVDALSDTHDRLERHMRTTDAAQAALDAELRAYLRGLDNGERRALVKSDPRYAAAVARAPASLSGANEKLAADARDAHLANVAPDDLAAFNDLSAAELCARETLAALDRLPLVELACDFRRSDELERASAAAGSV